MNQKLSKNITHSNNWITINVDVNDIWDSRTCTCKSDYYIIGDSVVIFDQIMDYGADSNCSNKNYF